MNRFVNIGIIGFRDGTGKGGHHRVYFPLMNEKEYRTHIIKTIVESMTRDFPKETRIVLNAHIGTHK